MKKLILALVSFIFCGIVQSQIYTPVNPTTYGEFNNRSKDKFARHIPEKDGLLLFTSDTTAQIFLNKQDSSLWVYYKPKGFFKISGGSGGGGGGQVNSDWLSTSGVSQILNKPNIPTFTFDTATGSARYVLGKYDDDSFHLFPLNTQYGVFDTAYATTPLTLHFESGTRAWDVLFQIDSVALPLSGVTAGTYTNATITVDNKGIIHLASNGTNGSTNVNIGSGYRLAVPTTNNIKTLFNGYAVKIDSSTNTNGLTFKVDSSLISTVSALHDTAAAIRLAIGTGGGGGPGVVKQIHTTGATITPNNTTTWLVVDPASILSTLTITMPATPVDGQDLDISFGGTITASGATVVTNLTIVGNTGQTLIGSGAYGLVETNDHISYRYNLSNLKWYRN